MPSRLRLLPALLGAAGLLAADARAEDRPTAFTVNAPIVNFRVPTFTRQNHRSWLLCGSEGRYVDQNHLDITNLNLSVFSGDATERVESVFLSPSATAFINDGLIQGPGGLRLITDDFEATGEDWRYDHRQKKVSIRKNVRVVFHTGIKQFLR